MFTSQKISIDANENYHDFQLPIYSGATLVYFLIQVLHFLRINILMNQIFAELLLKHFRVRNCKQQQQL